MLPCQMSSTPDISRLRQSLRRIAVLLPARIEAAMQVRGEVMPASLSKTHKVCGNPNCKCARGDKHVVYQLSWTDDGGRRCAHVKRVDLDRVRAAVERYRQLKRSRAELLKLAAQAASMMDEIADALRVSLPDRKGERHG